MLSRKLDVDCAHHDLDSLAERHGLQAGVRHRALPDAMLAWQLWQALHRQHPAPVIAEAVENLVAGPLLPAHLPPELIDKLPEAPGIYVFHDSRDEALLAGKARNLRLRVLNYFRVDGLSAKALAISHRIANITWRPTQGMLGADLQLATLAKGLPAKKRAAARELYSWRLDPHAYPTLGLTSLSDPRALRAEESFGVYESERKARNSLARVAARHRLCHSLAGISDSDRAPCLACGELQTGSQCGRKVDRLKHLTRLYSALRPLRLPSWPYPGPIAIRERSDLHIVDRWQYLGTARHECEIPAVLETRRGELDKDVFLLLAKKLPRLAPDKIVPLTECGRRPGSENTKAESLAYE